MRYMMVAVRTALAWLLLAAVSTAPALADTAASIKSDVTTADGYVAAGELREAVVLLERAQAQLQPDSPAAIRSLVLGRLGGSLGEDERATTLLGRAIDLARTA